MFKNYNYYALILAGGNGSRLWPLSRNANPKQCQYLHKPDQSLLQDTYLRLQELINPSQILVITNQNQASKIYTQLKEIECIPFELQNLLKEPCGKNTAPAILWSALLLNEQNPNAIMVVLPSDHIIENYPAFHKILEQALIEAEKGYLVTLGILPEFPETGYGYIQTGAKFSDQVYWVKQFVEKPNQEKAQEYINSGDYFWNSGIFIFNVPVLLDHYQKFAPDLWETFHSAKQNHNSWNHPEVVKKAYEQVQSISIDYAILEKSDQVLVIPSKIGWNDLGSWEAVYNLKEKDENLNIVNGNVITIDTKKSLIKASHKLISVIGLENIIVVETEDAVLICDKKQSQKIKQVVEILQNENRSEI